MFDSTEELEALRDRPTDELAAIYAELDSLEAQVRYQRLFVLGLLDERRVADSQGATDTVAWVAGTSRLQGRDAAAEVAAARRLAEQPAIAAAAAEGRLSRDQLDPLLQIATPDTDEQWAAAAPATAPGHLAYRARHVRAVTRKEAVRRQREESVSWREDPDAGMVRGTFALADVGGATFVKAIEREMEHAGPNAGGEWEPHERRAAAALIAIASRRLGDDKDGERAVITIIAPAEALTEDSGAPGSELPDLELGLAIDTVRRLACDATTQLLLTSIDGVTPIGLGRRQRTVPPWLRRYLRQRDHHCRFPGCTRTRGLHAHHRRHWADGGRTDPDNLFLLCTYHHRLVHEGGWTVRGDPMRSDGLRFITPNGTAYGVHGVSTHARAPAAA